VNRRGKGSSGGTPKNLAERKGGRGQPLSLLPKAKDVKRPLRNSRPISLERKKGGGRRREISLQKQTFILEERRRRETEGVLPGGVQGASAGKKALYRDDSASER